MAGVWYGKDSGAEGAWSLDKLTEQLTLPEREQLEPWSYQIEREDRGATVLFSIWQRSSLGRKTPSDIRFTVEVDAQTRLPSQARVYLDTGQQNWQQVSEFNYLDYDVPLADELFAVADDAVQSFTDTVRFALPFEQILDPFVPWKQAIYMPLDGMDIVVHPPWDDPSKGYEGHASFSSAEITRHEFHHVPLARIARVIGEMPVEPRIERMVSGVMPDLKKMLSAATPEQKLAQQRYSARIAYSHSLTPSERVQRLGRRFGFAAEVEERQGTRTRWIFTQDGSEFPTSALRGELSITGSSFRATGRSLGSVIESVLKNAAIKALVEGYDPDLDEIELQWDGAVAASPFERPVAIAIDFSAGWDAALDSLHTQFGVAMERVAEPITYEVLVLRPHGQDTLEGPR